MLVNLPTDFGKSMIFQCLPIVADGLHDIPRDLTVIVVSVILSLRSLMADQVQSLKILSECTGSSVIRMWKNQKLFSRS